MPLVRDWKIEHPNAEGFLGFARTALAAASASYPAPLKCIDVIEAAGKQPFSMWAFQTEREIPGAVAVQTPESMALRHGFFGERAAGKIVADIGADVLLA